MRKILQALAVLILMLSALVSCGSQVSPQQGRPPTENVIPLQSAVDVPSACHPGKVYQSSETAQASLAGIPWAKAEPASSRIIAYLFFARPHTLGSRIYQPLHVGGRSVDGTSMKILWSIDNPQASKTIAITGRQLLDPQMKTFSQTFLSADTPAKMYPSTINVPAAGCWQLTLKSGMTTGTLIFWVLGN